jgi:hypothetical protein
VVPVANDLVHAEGGRVARRVAGLRGRVCKRQAVASLRAEVAHPAPGVPLIRGAARALGGELPVRAVGLCTGPEHLVRRSRVGRGCCVRPRKKQLVNPWFPQECVGENASSCPQHTLTWPSGRRQGRCCCSPSSTPSAGCRSWSRPRRARPSRHRSAPRPGARRRRACSSARRSGPRSGR